VNQFLGEKAREQQAQHIHRNVCDDVFRGQIFSVQMIDPSGAGVGGHKAVGQLGDARMHGASIGELAAKGKAMPNLWEKLQAPTSNIQRSTKHQ
jgi:hypothetical protein